MREPQNNDYFPLSEYEDRVARLQTLMQEHGFDAVLQSTEPNVVYCTGLQDGYWVCTMHDDCQLALIPADSGKEPVLLLPDSLEQTAWTSCSSDIRVWSQFTAGKTRSSVETVADAFVSQGVDKGKVGLEIGEHDRPGMSLPYFQKLQATLPGVSFEDSTPVMKQVRKVKSPREIDTMREGCRISCEAIGAGMDSIKEGMSERELAHIIAQEMSRLSPDVTVNHPWILMIHSDGRGPSAYDGIPSSYRFKQGDTVYVDSGFVNRGYPTDMIRCAVIGKPTKDQERYYYASRDANMAAIEYVKPGMLARDLYAYWAETVCKLGFEESLRSQQEADWDFLGHGLGLAAHELPLLNSTSEEPIVAGMIMAIEGNVFDKFPFKETKIALKNEDDVLVTKDGSEWLTSLSNDLWIA